MAVDNQPINDGSDLSTVNMTNILNHPFSSLIDWAYLHELSDGNRAFELELLQSLVESLPSHLYTLRTKILIKDFSNIEREAHYIKGTTASMGARFLETFAAQLEQKAIEEHAEGMEALLSQIEHGFEQMQTLVRAGQ